MRGDCQAACTRVLWREASVVRTENRGAMWHEEGGMLGEPQHRPGHDEDSERKEK